LGYPVQALQRSQEALTLAEKLAHPHSLAFARHSAASLHHHRREVSAVQALAEARTVLGAYEQDDLVAETYRLQGEFLLRRAVPDAAQAEASFRQALAMARRQQAKSWELRAATSLSRLCLQQGKRAEAHALLAPIYGWFTEGFDTADLQEARALLEEVGG
jgi:predicted ATPase